MATALATVAGCGANALPQTRAAVASTANSTTEATPAPTPAPTAVTTAPVPRSVAVCDDRMVFPLGPSETFTPKQAAAAPFALALVNLLPSHPDVLAGVRWDRATDELVVLAVDVAQAQPITAAAALPGQAFRIELVQRSYNQLQGILRLLMPKVADAKLAYSGYARFDGRVQVDLGIRDASAISLITELAGDDADAVCVQGGADPATVAREGPQPTSGDGWRLLADLRTGAGRPITVAASASGYAKLWKELRETGAAPRVDFTLDVVLAFSSGGSSSCRGRLDALTFDIGGAVLRPTIVVPGGLRPCTADLVPHSFLLAVPRDRLPPLPFRVEMRTGPCSAGCDGDPLRVTTLTNV